MTELGYPTSVEEMNRHLKGISADPSYCTLVAETEEQVLGVAGLHPVFSFLGAILG
jgi:L-amino acid N-acyltransferase YncA